MEASLSPVSGLRFDLGYTYLRTKLIDFDIPVLPPESPFATINPSAVKGSVLALSPKNRLTLTGTYTLPLDETIGEVSLGATYTHTDEQVGNASSPLGLLPATDLLNLNVNWKEAFGQPVDLAFFVTNVTNEVYPVQTNGSITTAGFDSFVMGQPRMWGFRLRYSFGE